MKKFIALSLVSILFIGCGNTSSEISNTEETTETTVASNIENSESKAYTQLKNYAELTFKDSISKVEVYELNDSRANILCFIGAPTSEKSIEQIFKLFSLGIISLNSFIESKEQEFGDISYDYIDMIFLDDENKGIINFELNKTNNNKYETKDSMASVNNFDIIVNAANNVSNKLK